MRMTRMHECERVSKWDDDSDEKPRAEDPTGCLPWTCHGDSPGTMVG
jgi:hypothetical protein